MLEAYRQHIAERAAEGIVPKPLSATQVNELTDLLKAPPAGEENFLLDLLSNRVPAGVDDAAYIKAGFLADIAKGKAESPIINRLLATQLLGTMLGGYNIQPLIDLLDDSEAGETAAIALSSTLLMFDAFHDVVEKTKNGNANAIKVMNSWANAEWFTQREKPAAEIKLTVFKVDGETNTDDLSPAGDAWSRPDIPLHAQSMLIKTMDAPLTTIEKLKEQGHPLAYVGDVVGTGSSRKSATNSVLWHMGEDIPYIANKRDGGFVLGGKIAPIFFNTMEDAGALPIECDVSQMQMGDIITIHPYKGEITNDNNEVISKFELASDVLLDEVQAGGRIPLIIGRGLTERAREALDLGNSDIFRKAIPVEASTRGYTLAQKMVGKACGTEGIRPGSYCEPKMTTVGSQDTTGPMTRDELKELACLGFSADLVMQSFCHTAAYPKPVDIETQHQLPDFIQTRGGVALRPGDGIIHSWLNRMLLPDTVGTGGDSHTRFPIGISFPAGSGLVAFASALGVMPLDMPESVLVRFSGEIQPGITLRDLVNAIPYAAIQKGLLTVAKAGKKNVFSGRILEIEGLPDLKVEQAFEISDASAERSAGGCTIRLGVDPIKEYLNSNVTLLKWMISEGYGDSRTIARRIEAMQSWLDDPKLMEPDPDAEYFEIIEIDLNEITEPLLACPNDPDDIKPLSEVAGTKIDEVFIGSCMTNIGHFRAAAKMLSNASSIPTRLWISPPTKMDEHQLMQEGVYNIFAQVGARTEMPGCSLCMGNQARIAANSTAVSTSTRNFPNRLGDGADVFLASAELSAVASILGRLPTLAEYLSYAADLDALNAEIYRYLNFNQIESFQQSADAAVIPTVNIVNAT
ncbi:MAG: bifunctional aconitate hydratase 2/2-methylisocitrate dehydratase [Gammaproteobacteria bacterium]|nr:bifunctional aconitate hydratase 2/2-methylisocitrate dehydratase [Gammaproteobacteria bacterium]MBT5201922.1 bifunctional aconitate hydratase 2/2-methylisocitrate dehydratase [Gammaproteobacteria bacterium]MBT5602439.1 bifunctional aconitate hydratase 2/2-methylisocitrate dehydratase [Gammaproteobacteria bacterium]MBT6245227.1 bifunctional aconitate hydratase 2/2-methylisocitrate dehydratase [Gammaproteobacteria bacterium]